MGAIASGGVRVLANDLISQLGISRARVEAVIERETGELVRREACYRGGRDFPDVSGHTVIVVDDGIATGATMSAAIGLLRQLHAARIVVAVPVAPLDTLERLRREADEVVVLCEPEYFSSVGEWYQDFTQTSDGEVRELLAGCRDG